MTPEQLTPVLPPRTRRQALRAALAGAAALTLPLGVRAAPARAAGPNDCRKGCDWTVDQRFASNWNGCVNTLASTPLLLLYAPLLSATQTINALICRDRTILSHKAGHYDCSQPNCPGFDPKAAGGPCDTCRDSCCPCQASVSGYICCIFPCGDPDHNCCPE
jgi:hypothetical protein